MPAPRLGTWGMAEIEIFLEVGRERTFASALAWPGWCRGGRDEASAMEALLAYGSRYAEALRGARLGFRAPTRASVRVVERLPGNATTDFGAPDAVPAQDTEPMSEEDLRRSVVLLEALWRALDRAATAAEGLELRKGPRGGGRDLERILRHVAESEGAYLSMIGARLRLSGDPAEDLELARRATVEGLARAVREGVPPSPRGGKRWTPRTFVRRSAWHVLDHAWEIEDRSTG